MIAAAGNLTVFGSVNVSYDAENRQKAAGSTIYLYDGLGQRLGKSTPANTAYVYDAFGRLAEGLTLGNPWQQDYIRFGGELLVVENNTAFTIQPPCATCYLTYDQLGSVRMVTDGNANVMAFHDYAPFGQEIPAGVGGRTSLWGGSDSASQRFTGQMRDTETYLDFFNARYLSSGLGRFMSVDPGNAGAVGADPQTWNGYGYVRNTPLSLVDPSGMTGEYSGIQGGPGYCPPSQATCPTGQPPVGGGPQTPNEINVGEQWYVNNVVVPGYLSAIPGQYPGLVQFYAAQGSTSTTIYYGLALLAKLSAEDVGMSGDVAVGLDIFHGQQGLWGGTAATGNALGAATAGVIALPFAVGGAVGASTGSILNTVGAFGPSAGRVFWSEAGAAAAATRWATAWSGTTLGQTPVGRGISALSGLGLREDVTLSLWRAASAAFAQGAEGPVVLFTEGASGLSTFVTRELPVIVANGTPIVAVW